MDWFGHTIVVSTNHGKRWRRRVRPVAAFAICVLVGGLAASPFLDTGKVIAGLDPLASVFAGITAIAAFVTWTYSRDREEDATTAAPVVATNPPTPSSSVPSATHPAWRMAAWVLVVISGLSTGLLVAHRINAAKDELAEVTTTTPPPEKFTTNPYQMHRQVWEDPCATFRLRDGTDAKGIFKHNKECHLPDPFTGSISEQSPELHVQEYVDAFPKDNRPRVDVDRYKAKNLPYVADVDRGKWEGYAPAGYAQRYLLFDPKIGWSLKYWLEAGDTRVVITLQVNTQQRKPGEEDRLLLESVLHEYGYQVTIP